MSYQRPKVTRKVADMNPFLQMTALKIAAKSWTRLSESSLDTFSTNAADVLTAPAYDVVRTSANALAAAAATYHTVYSRYRQSRGFQNKEARDSAKAALYSAHQTMAADLDDNAAGNADFLTLPGYLLDRTGGRASHARVIAPYVSSVESNKVRGRVKFILKAQNVREIKGITGRYSLDNGVTWVNGIHAYTLNFTLNNQPVGQTIVYQFMFEATSGRKSDWSERVYVEMN